AFPKIVVKKAPQAVLEDVINDISKSGSRISVLSFSDCCCHTNLLFFPYIIKQNTRAISLKKSPECLSFFHSSLKKNQFAPESSRTVTSCPGRIRNVWGT